MPTFSEASVAGCRLGVVGYSTRALAEAAFDLGFEVTAIDAFCDQDTRAVAQCQIAHRWPQDVIACGRNVPCAGWLLAGGMENHGRLVAQLAALAPVYGPTRAQLAVLRSPRFWRELCKSVPGLRMPATFPSASSHNTPLRLYKPRRSSGGMYVTEASAALDTTQLPRGYWQEFIAGRVLGATSWIGNSQAHFLGATESLAAEQWPGPRPFVYRGSLGPVDLAPRQRDALLALAARIGEQLDYRGYLQADLIEDACGDLWLLELNPRWTAGMELLHLCAGQATASPLAAHLTAFGIAVTPREQPSLQPPATCAKAILYAPRELQLSLEQRCRLQKFRQRQSWGEAGWWNIADVPPVDDIESLSLAMDQPLLTLRVGLKPRDMPWGQVRQTLLHGLTLARTEVMQRIFGPV